MHPTRPLLIWVLVAGACAALLTVEGALLLSRRQRRMSGWRLGVSLILGSLMASGLAARLFDIHAELIGPQCNCEPFQWTDPRIATPLVLGTVLGSAVLVLTAYGGVRALRSLRSPAASVTERNGASAWSFLKFSWSLFVLGVMADIGAWITANGVTHLAESVSYSMNDPFAGSSDGLGILPLFYAIVATVCGALVLLLPLSLMLVVLRRSSRAFPLLAERWLSVATVASVLAAFFAAVDEQLANFLMSDFWWTLQVAAWFLAGCAFVVAGVYAVQETRRGSGTQRQRP
jgi:hypothetical protein